MKILNPPTVLVSILRKSRASKDFVCVYRYRLQGSYEELGYMWWWRLRKFPDVPSISWRTRRAVAHLSQKACEPTEPACEFQSEKLAVSRPRSWCFSPGPKARKEQCLAQPIRQEISLSQPFLLCSPLLGRTICFTQPADSDANLIQKPLQATPRMMLAESRTDTLWPSHVDHN